MDLQTDEQLFQYYQAENQNIDMPSRNHAKIWSKLVVALSKYKDKYDIYSQLSINLNGKETIPDICLYLKSETNWLEDEIQVLTPPLLIIEILSPKQGIQDLTEKFKEYFKAGVISCWLVQPMLKVIFVIDNQWNQKVFTTGNITDAKVQIEIEFEEVFG